MRTAIFAVISVVAFSITPAVAAPPPHAGPPAHAGGPGSAPTPLSEVGRYVKHLGATQTRNISFVGNAADCPDPALAECVVLNPAPASTGFSFDGLGEIELAPGAMNSLLCFAMTPFYQMSFDNPTPFKATARTSIQTTVRIENAALVGGMNFATGLPFAGVYESGATTYFEEWQMDVGEQRTLGQLLSRDCTGGFLNANLLSGLGFTDEQIRDIFASPMTVSFGVNGNMQLAALGSLSIGVRLYGD